MVEGSGREIETGAGHAGQRALAAGRPAATADGVSSPPTPTPTGARDLSHDVGKVHDVRPSLCTYQVSVSSR